MMNQSIPEQPIEWQNTKSYNLFDTALLLGLVYGLVFVFNNASFLRWVNDWDQNGSAISQNLKKTHQILSTFRVEQPRQALRNGFSWLVGLEQSLDEIGFAQGQVTTELDLSEPFNNETFGIQAKYVVAMGLDIAVPGSLALDENAGHLAAVESSPPSASHLMVADIASIGEQQVLVVGDSIMGGIAPQIKREMRKMGIKSKPVIEWKVSSGLGRPDYFNWPQVTQSLMNGKKVDYAVALFGTNDVKALKHDGRFIAYASDEWQKIYDQRVAEMQTILCQGVKKVYWIALPPMKKEDLNKGAEKLNQIYKTHADQSDCIEFLPIASLVGDEQGQFTAYRTLGDERIQMRAKDGIHLSAKGGNIVAKYVLDRIGQHESSAVNSTVLAH